MSSKWRYFLCSVLNLVTTLTDPALCSNNCRKPYLDILVSPVIDSDVRNQLILIWNVEFLLHDGWIVLKNDSAEIFKSAVNVSISSVETNIPYVPLHYSPAFTRQDLGYHVEYRQGVTGAVIATASMETNPTWMSDQAAILGDFPLSRLFIPGTHDSGSYTVYTDQAVHGEKRIEKYVMTQDETILSQLIFGIRSLDLRVGYYSIHNNRPQDLYINHSFRKVQPLSNVIQEVKYFLQNTREIVILDFHAFPVGFNLRSPNVKPHDTLIEYLLQELGPFIAPPNLTWHANLNDFWALNKTLILAYNNKNMVVKYSNILWPPVNQKWGNAQEPSKLESFLSMVFNSPPEAPWSAQAELTATGADIVSDRLKGLRHMAAAVNNKVTLWFQGVWGMSANIVSCDFFRGTGIVKTAMTWNFRRARKESCDV